jgi:hypothetical protein
MKIAVLGCGPAGLLVAHACARAGVAYDVLSRKVPSRIGGAQYLHQAIPDLTSPDPDGEVTFIKWGNAVNYKAKVYGEADVRTSWFDYHSGTYPVWNMAAAYRWLWEAYQDRILDVSVDWRSLNGICLDYNYVFSTVPYPALVPLNNPWTFESQVAYIKTEDPGLIEDMTIIYNGERATPWYRASCIFGLSSTEWTHDPRNHDSEAQVVVVRKPLRTDCTAWPHIFKFGRYGRWEKGVLIHHAFEQAEGVLAEL